MAYSPDGTRRARHTPLIQTPADFEVSERNARGIVDGPIHAVMVGRQIAGPFAAYRYRQTPIAMP